MLVTSAAAQPAGGQPTAAATPVAVADTTPEAVARAYASAMRRADWGAAAAFMHPDALAKLRTMFAPILEADTSGRIGATVFGVRSAAAYHALPDADRFVRLMRALMAQRPQLRPALEATDTQIIGHVREGADTAHVVIRSRTPAAGATVEKTSVVSMQRIGKGWGLLLSGDIEGLAAALRGRSGT